MPTKTRINGENYTQLPRLVSDDIILKGLPNTPGAPAGYGDVRTAILNAGAAAQITQAQASNLYTVPEWTPAPAHAVSTAYAGGKAVTNAGKTYLAIVGGTSGAASAPTATTNAPIVDGSVQWLYLGPAPAAISGAPTLTLEGSTPAPLTKELRTTAQETWYRVRGGNYSFSADGIGWVTGEPKNTSGLCFEFMTDAVDMVIMFRFGTAQYRVAVDDRFVSPDVQIGASTTRLRIQMNGERKARKVQIFFNGSNNLYALYVTPADTVWRTSYQNDLNLFVVGDSFIGGSSWHPGTNERSVHHRLAYQLGATQYQADGVGGSGYISSGSETPFGSATRLARISTAADIIVIAGGINDTATGLQAAVVSYLQAVRARCPNALIVVCGSWAGNTGPSATILDKENQISAAVTQLADPRIVFVPISTANNAVTFGTGNVSALANNGNSDVYTSPDGIHPIVQACQYLANRVALGLISKLEGA